MSDQGLLTFVQWMSPAFPVGGYAYSQGLEWAITAGDVTDAAGLAAWLDAVLRYGAIRADAIVLAQALRPDTDLAGLAEFACALAPGRERLTETLEQGRAFGLTAQALTGGGIAATAGEAMPYPVAVGAAARGLGLAPQRVVALFLQSVLGNLVQVAVRFVPLGQTEGQQVLAGLTGAIESVAAGAVETGLADIGGAGVRADIAGLKHEEMDVRIYRT